MDSNETKLPRRLSELSDQELDQAHEEESAWTYEENLHALDLTENQLKGKKILDIGAGSGFFAVELRKRITDSNIVSIDKDNPLNPTKSRVLKSLQAQSNKKDWVIGVAERLPFQDSTFDLTLTNGFMPDSVDVLEEAFRVIKQGGEVRWSMVYIEELNGQNHYENLEKIIAVFKKSQQNAVVEIRPLAPIIPTQKSKFKCFVLIIKKL